ncbi:MAG TPA: hypothetical protein VEC38_07205 [Candidatus Binataceae bacterium]|nr:hypothetical protein [Candidatus Binataceae bacterium]
MLNDARMLVRFYRGLRRFLRAPLSVSEAEQSLRVYLDARENSFLDLMDRAVYRQPRSPWRTLLDNARIELGDVREMVRRSGIESTLARLYDAGVYVTVQEAKGKQPIVRDGVEIRVHPEDFDNPVLPGSFEVLSGGSSGPRRRLLIDFELLEHDVRAHRLLIHSFDLERRPSAIWWPGPPGSAGLKHAIMQARSRLPEQRWFSQTNPSLRASPMQSWLLLQTALAGMRRSGIRYPSPEYLPLDNPAAIVTWLVSRKREGTPALFGTIVSSAIRVCQAAQANGMDISGTFFRIGAEALTEAGAEMFRSAGTSFACAYATAETGPIGYPCATGASADDVHLFSGKIAVLARPGPEGRSALFLTTLLAATPRIMLNAESGDSAAIESRSCGCVFGQLGYLTHLHHIRSYEKVSGEGMYFLGAELAALVEDFLPRRFGGAPTDYQFVHEQRGGMTRVRLLISSKVGALDTAEVRDAVLRQLAIGSRGDRMKSEIWASGEILSVERGEPAATAASKILPVCFVGDE